MVHTAAKNTFTKSIKMAYKQESEFIRYASPGQTMYSLLPSNNITALASHYQKNISTEVVEIIEKREDSQDKIVKKAIKIRIV